VAGIGELDAVVKDGHAQGFVLVPPASVRQHVQDRFPDGQEGDRECVLVTPFPIRSKAPRKRLGLSKEIIR
jgi:hypothetical protein